MSSVRGIKHCSARTDEHYWWRSDGNEPGNVCVFRVQVLEGAYAVLGELYFFFLREFIIENKHVADGNVGEISLDDFFFFYTLFVY